MNRASVAQHDVVEIALGTVDPSAYPESAIVDVIFTEPGGMQRRVPAFASRKSWRVRYSSFVAGRLTYRVESEVALPAPAGEVVTAPRDGHPLLSHGGVRIPVRGRHLKHSDGTPFLYLADPRPGIWTAPAGSAGQRPRRTRLAAQFIDPRTGERHPPFVLRPDQHGQAILPGGFGKALPTRSDWVLLLRPLPKS